MEHQYFFHTKWQINLNRLSNPQAGPRTLMFVSTDIEGMQGCVFVCVGPLCVYMYFSSRL